MDTLSAVEQRRSVVHAGPARQPTDEETRLLFGLLLLSTAVVPGDERF